MSSQEKLLQQAVGQYSKVLETTRAIEAVLDDFQAPVIERLCQDLNLEMNRARELDSKVDSTFSSQKNIEIIELVRERQKLMEQILAVNTALEPRLKGIRAMQLNEMKQIKLGRKTASGYARHVTQKTGRIINSSK